MSTVTELKRSAAHLEPIARDLETIANCLSRLVAVVERTEARCVAVVDAAVRLPGTLWRVTRG